VSAGGSSFAPRAKPDICLEAKALKDKSGSYIKTLCMISSFSTYDDAVNTCSANNMTLFTIESEAQQTELLEYSETYFAAYVDPSLWINGKKDTNGIFKSVSPGKSLFTGLKWYGGSPIGTGDCLMVKKTIQPFYVQPENCEAVRWFYCEYD
jgi:hypothetical protein